MLKCEMITVVVELYQLELINCYIIIIFDISFVVTSKTVLLNKLFFYNLKTSLKYIDLQGLHT